LNRDSAGSPGPGGIDRSFTLDYVDLKNRGLPGAENWETAPYCETA
jgi:hypothetical protein